MVNAGLGMVLQCFLADDKQYSASSVYAGWGHKLNTNGRQEDYALCRVRRAGSAILRRPTRILQDVNVLEMSNFSKIRIRHGTDTAYLLDGLSIKPSIHLWT